MNTSKISKLEKEIQKLEFAVKVNKNDYSDLQLQIDNFEPDLTEEYDQMLDEIYSDEVKQITFVCLPCPSELLKDCDPIAYRCGYNDFVDSFDLELLEEYSELLEQLENIESNIEDLENEIEEIQEEIEALEDEDQ